jgi:hypothetical protein
MVSASILIGTSDKTYAKNQAKDKNAFAYGGARNTDRSRAVPPAPGSDPAGGDPDGFFPANPGKGKSRHCGALRRAHGSKGPFSPLSSFGGAARPTRFWTAATDARHAGRSGTSAFVPSFWRATAGRRCGTSSPPMQSTACP